MQWSGSRAGLRAGVPVDGEPGIDMTAMEERTAETAELEATLVRIRQPLVSPPMPPVALWLAVKTSPGLRRMLPGRLAVTLGRSRGKAIWRREPDTRREAIRSLEAIVGGTPRAGEAAALAREQVIEREIHRMLFWQPWKMARMDARSTQNVTRALESGRAVLLSSCHLGPIFLHLSAITSRKRGYILSAPWFFEEPSSDYWGRRLAHWRRRLMKRNERLVPTSGAYPVLRELLRQDELVVVYFDMPGSRETSFLGKPVMLATGTARLAAETGALVLPVRARRNGHRAWTDVSTPLDPTDFDGFESLHDALAAVHERWILERPATLESPDRPGAWEHTATARGWTRPDAA